MTDAVQIDFLPLITEAEHPQYLLNGKAAQGAKGGATMTTHSDKRRDKARIIANDNGISVRQAYRRLRNVEVSAENEDFDYEAETPKGEWV